MKLQWWIASPTSSSSRSCYWRHWRRPARTASSDWPRSEGFAESATEAPFSVLSGYLFPGIENETVAVLLAGWIGVTAIFLLAGGLALALQRRRALRD